jgi:hypothetical protein
MTTAAKWEEQMELACAPDAFKPRPARRMEYIPEGERFLRYLIDIGADWDECEDKWRLVDDADNEAIYYKWYTTEELFTYFYNNKRP